MLYPSAVEPHTLAVLKRLVQLPVLEPFALAGGTNLALRFGHRISIDLDWFTDKPFSTQPIFENIQENVSKILKINEERNTLTLTIESVKVDFLAHRYPILKSFERIDGIPLWSVEDIAAMKLNAVSSRGAKKDFWDIAELLKHFSLMQMLLFFQEKYPQSDLGFVVRSLTYFDDAEQQPDPVSLNNSSWPRVKQTIVEAVRSVV